MSAYESPTMSRLKTGRGLAWRALQPAFDHAIMLAEEAEHYAVRAQNIAMTGVDPSYPPLVLKLAESAPAPEAKPPYGDMY